MNDISLKKRVSCRLKMITIVGINDEAINEHFPLNSKSKDVINEMSLISKCFKKQGRGSIQTKDNLYFYRTYTQEISNNEEDEKIFILMYTDSKYPSDIANKCLDEIIATFSEKSFELSALSKETKNEINNIFKTYEDGNNSKLFLRKTESQSQIKKMDKSDDNVEGTLSLSYEAELKKAKQSSKNKEIKIERESNNNPIFNLGEESEIKVENSQTNIRSSEIENDVDMTAMFLQENTVLIKVKRWRKIKVLYIIICIILALLAYALIPILVYFVQLKS